MGGIGEPKFLLTHNQQTQANPRSKGVPGEGGDGELQTVGGFNV